MLGTASKARFTKSVSTTLFVLALFLLSANTAGLVTSLRNEEIFVEKNTLFQADITLAERDVHELIHRPPDDRKSYVRAVTQAVNKGIAHYLWLDEGIGKYNLRVPFHENYLLFIASYVIPHHYRKYEFRDYRRAIERGVGLCSQHAIIVAEILKEKGIGSGILSLPGHVVAVARVDDGKDEWWILDADYGVVIPHAPRDIENASGIVAPYYRKQGYDERTVENIAAIYAKKGRLFMDGARQYGVKIYWIEQVAYVLIWILPGVLMLPLGVIVIRNRSGARQEHRGTSHETGISAGRGSPLS